MISVESIKQYVENKGRACPFCGSDFFTSISGYEPHLEEKENPDIVYQYMHCLDCKKSWWNVFKLIDIDFDEEADE